MRIATTILPLIAAFAGVSAAAYDPIVLKRGWERVDYTEDGACTGEVGSNGRFYVLSVYGLAPGEPARLVITNGDMRPIVRTVRASAGGTWQDYYVAFRPNHYGDYVTATVTSATCRIPLGFEWTRAIGWDEPPPLKNPYRR